MVVGIVPERRSGDDRVGLDLELGRRIGEHLGERFESVAECRTVACTSAIGLIPAAICKEISEQIRVRCLEFANGCIDKVKQTESEMAQKEEEIETIDRAPR